MQGLKGRKGEGRGWERCVCRRGEITGDAPSLLQAAAEMMDLCLWRDFQGFPANNDWSNHGGVVLFFGGAFPVDTLGRHPPWILLPDRQPDWRSPTTGRTRLQQFQEKMQPCHTGMHCSPRPAWLPYVHTIHYITYQ